MKLILRISTILIFLLLVNSVAFGQNRQFKCGQTNCTGLCGRFTDQDGDGFCDLDLVTNFKQDTAKVIKLDTLKPKKKENSETKKAVTNTKQSIQNTPSDSLINETQKDTIALADNSTAKTSNQKSYPYDLLLISAITIGFYLLTFVLYKTRIFRRQIHRRIWNSLLLITFLGSGIIGLLLVIQINYHIWLGIYRDFLYWHVQLGIAMAIISIFHALWHLSYFKRLFNKLPKTDSEC